MQAPSDRIGHFSDSDEVPALKQNDAIPKIQPHAGRHLIFDPVQPIVHRCLCSAPGKPNVNFQH
jgi:hypothetical protein